MSDHRCLRLIGLCVTFLTVTSNPLLGTVRHIYQSDGAQGIQDSIDASAAYDTVMVHSGIYYVRDIDSVGITMKDSVRLISPYRDSVTLSGTNSAGTDTAYHVIFCDFGDSSSHEAVIEGFTMTGGCAEFHGGGIYCWESSPVIRHNLVRYNVAGSMGGGVFSELSSPVLENNTAITIPLEHNFWWDTTDTGVSSLIKGPNDHIPWENDFLEEVPGEPLAIDCVRNYSSDYSVIVDSLRNNPDTLYLEIRGEDRNARFREAAVAIVKSNVYPTGIAVALVETDTNSGVYQGKATVKTSSGSDTIRIDDIYNVVKADSGCNMITITANMDTTKSFVVFYRCGTATEERWAQDVEHLPGLRIFPCPFLHSTNISYRVPSLSVPRTKISLSVCDLAGRVVRTLIDREQKPGRYSVRVDDLPAGAYFARLSVGGDQRRMKKLILVR